MSVTGATTRNDYVASSGQTVFQYTFQTLAASDITVIVNGAALSLGSEYAVSNVGVAGGGNITLTSGAIVGQIVNILLAMPIDRTTQYQNAGDFLASDVNGDLDKSYVAMNQLQTDISRSMHLKDKDSTVNMELPGASLRANKYLTFDGQGRPTVALPPSTNPSDNSTLSVINDFGVIRDDASESINNVTKINNAEAFCALNNKELTYEGLIYCQGKVIWQDKVHRRGIGVIPNLRPAPVTIGASTPVEQLTHTVGCELRFIGTPVKDVTIENVTEGSHSGFGCVNPRRAYNNAYDARFDLRDFSNQDAVGATPATLKNLSVAVYIKSDTLNRIYCEGITIRTACDGVSANGGAGLDGYTVTDSLPAWADYDIGLMVDSPWQSEFYRMNVIGYWNECGVYWTASRNAPEFNDSGEQFRGYSEGNLWSRCNIQSGWVYRTADSIPVLAKDDTADTISIPWFRSHQFAATGEIRVGASFVKFDTYNYTSVAYDSGTSRLIFSLAESDLSGIDPGNNGDHIFLSGGAGPAGTAMYGCDVTDLAPTSLLHEPAYNRPYKGAIEISGGVSRAIKLYNTIVNSHGFLPFAVGYAPDLQLSDCYSEPRRFRLTHGGALQDRGGIFLAGPNAANLELMGSAHNGSIYARGYWKWPGLNLSPLMFVSSTGWFGGLNGDWFTPRAYKQPIEEMSRDNLNTDFIGLRNEKVRVVARREDGEFYELFTGQGSNGTALVGQKERDGLSNTSQLVLPVDGAAVLRNDLHLRDVTDYSVKDIRNDQDNGLQTEAAPTASGFRFIGSLSQLRIKSDTNPALQLHRGADGRVAEFRRDGTIQGRISVYDGQTRFFVTDNSSIGYSSSTANRPTDVPNGYLYFDTTINRPIWKVNAGWVKADGTSA